MRFHFDFSELYKLIDDIARDISIASGKAEEAVADATERLYAQAKAAAPVDTGALRDAVRRDSGGLSRRVHTGGIRQAFFQEYGTSKMAPQPYLMVYADQAWSDLEQTLLRLRWGLSV